MEKQQARTALIVLILCCGGYILSMFHRACPAIIALDLGRDLGLDNTGLGLMSGATLLAYGLMQLPSGLLADRLGGRRSLALLLALGGLCAMGFASSHSAAAAVSFRFLEGIGLAITIPAMVILAGCYPPQSFGRAYSIFLSSGGIGTILAARPLAELNALWGWRLSIIGFSLLTLALAAAVWLLIREPARPVQDKKAERPSMLRGIARVLRTPQFWPMALWGMGIMGSYFAMFTLWWGPYLLQGCGLDPATASSVLTAGAFMALLSQPVAGWLSDSVLRRRRLPLIAGAGAGLAASLCMAFFQGFEGWTAVLLVIAFVAGTAMFSPLTFAMARETFPMELIGTAGGLMNIFPPVWGVVTQKIYGMLLDAGGGTSPEAFRLAAWALAGNTALAFACALLMKETFGRRPSPGVRD